MGLEYCRSERLADRLLSESAGRFLRLRIGYQQFSVFTSVSDTWNVRPMVRAR